MMIDLPPLNDGEIYVGCIGDASGNMHDCILLPGDSDDGNWERQMAWARSIGGDLPNRVEQAILWANFRDHFQGCPYWSNEQHHFNSGSAWVQVFDNGGQISFHKYDELRARAVRRVSV